MVGWACCFICVSAEEALLRLSWTAFAVHVDSQRDEGRAAADTSGFRFPSYKDSIGTSAQSEERCDFCPDRKRCFLKNHSLWTNLKGGEN